MTPLPLLDHLGDGGNTIDTNIQQLIRLTGLDDIMCILNDMLKNGGFHELIILPNLGADHSLRCYMDDGVIV
jgi:hypothetical protein